MFLTSPHLELVGSRIFLTIWEEWDSSLYCSYSGGLSMRMLEMMFGMRPDISPLYKSMPHPFADVLATNIEINSLILSITVLRYFFSMLSLFCDESCSRMICLLQAPENPTSVAGTWGAVEWTLHTSRTSQSRAIYYRLLKKIFSLSNVRLGHCGYRQS